MINEIWNLLSKLKGIKEEKLIIDESDSFIMKAFHKKLKGIIPYKLWKKIVIDYSISTNQGIYDACDDLLDKVYDKYKK